VARIHQVIPGLTSASRRRAASLKTQVYVIHHLYINTISITMCVVYIGVHLSLGAYCLPDLKATFSVLQISDVSEFAVQISIEDNFFRTKIIAEYYNKALKVVRISALAFVQLGPRTLTALPRPPSWNKAGTMRDGRGRKETGREQCYFSCCFSVSVPVSVVYVRIAMFDSQIVNRKSYCSISETLC